MNEFLLKTCGDRIDYSQVWILERCLLTFCFINLAAYLVLFLLCLKCSKTLTVHLLLILDLASYIALFFDGRMQLQTYTFSHVQCFQVGIEFAAFDGMLSREK